MYNDAVCKTVSIKFINKKKLIMVHPYFWHAYESISLFFFYTYLLNCISYFPAYY